MRVFQPDASSENANGISMDIENQLDVETVAELAARKLHRVLFYQHRVLRWMQFVAYPAAIAAANE